MLFYVVLVWALCAFAQDIEAQDVATYKGQKWHINVVDFNPQGTRIVTGASEGNYSETFDDSNGAWRAALWDTDGNHIKPLEGHSDEMTTVSFNAEGNRILTVSRSDTAHLWDANGNLLKTLGTEDLKGVRFASFNSRGNHFLTGHVDGTVRLWDDGGQQLAILAGHTNILTHVMFNPQGDRILTASYTEDVRLWDADGTLIKIVTTYGQDRQSWFFRFNLQGSHFITSEATCDIFECWDDIVQLWDNEGNLIVEQAGLQANFNPQGTQVIFGHLDGTASLWDVDGTQISVLSGHTDVLSHVLFDAQGHRILTASNDGEVRLWDSSGNLISLLEHHEGGLKQASFSPRGDRLLTRKNGTVYLWDSEGRVITRRQVGDSNLEFGDLRFNVQGSYAIAIADRIGVLLNTEGELIKQFDSIRLARFNPQGTHLLTIIDQDHNMSREDLDALYAESDDWRDEPSFFLWDVQSLEENE